MSAQHHDHDAEHRMLQELLNKAEPRFPRGKISPTDRGELSFAVALDPHRKAVVIRFAYEVDWIGLDKESAIHLADLLKAKADLL